MKAFLIRWVLCLLLAALAGCDKESVGVGSKNFAENQILAEMFALLIEDAGLTVSRRIPVGETAETFEALRTHTIDVYPEYTGTASALLGLPWNPDVPTQIANEFTKLGIHLLAPLGFESSYVVLVQEEYASQHGLESISDLSALAGELRIAVREEFARRPLDGLRAFVDRYGLEFTAVEIVLGEDSSELYEALLESRADIVVGTATDSQIADFGMRVLQDDAGFFPAYTAVPLVSAAAPAAVTIALARIAGKIDAAHMARLTAEVQISRREPRAVAASALAELGLLDSGATEDDPLLKIAVDGAEIGSTMANRVLQAARDTVPGRIIVLEPGPRPVTTMLEGKARAAIAPSIAQFDIGENAAVLRDGVETVAAVGSYYLHVLARTDGPSQLSAAAAVATGPEGTASEKLGRVFAQSRPADIITLQSTDAEAAIAALQSRRADAAILIAPTGLADIEAALLEAPEVRLIDANSWWQGATRLAYPFLQPAIIPANTYPPGQRTAVNTLAMQATVAGQGPSAEPIGIAGPSSYVGKASPITDAVVLAFNRALGPHPDISPLLESAAVLRPHVEPDHQVLNQTPAYTVFSLGILAFLGWALWLLIRPDKRPDKE